MEITTEGGSLKSESQHQEVMEHFQLPNNRSDILSKRRPSFFRSKSRLAKLLRIHTALTSTHPTHSCRTSNSRPCGPLRRARMATTSIRSVLVQPSLAQIQESTSKRTKTITKWLQGKPRTFEARNLVELSLLMAQVEMVEMNVASPTSRITNRAPT